MLTFTANPSFVQVQEAACAVMPDKSVKHLDKFEQIGLSEGFVKKAEGKLKEQKFDAGAFGFTIERNIRISVIDREVPLVTCDEYDAGVRGVSEALVQVASFADDTWLESLDLNADNVVAVFDIMEDHIAEQENLKGTRHVPSLKGCLSKALAGNVHSTTTLTRLIEEYKDFNFLQVPKKNTAMLDFLKEVKSLGGLIDYILRNPKLIEVLGLYGNKTLTA